MHLTLRIQHWIYRSLDTWLVLQKLHNLNFNPSVSCCSPEGQPRRAPSPLTDPVLGWIRWEARVFTANLAHVSLFSPTAGRNKPHSSEVMPALKVCERAAYRRRRNLPEVLGATCWQKKDWGAAGDSQPGRKQLSHCPCRISVPSWRHEI